MGKMKSVSKSPPSLKEHFKKLALLQSAELLNSFDWNAVARKITKGLKNVRTMDTVPHQKRILSGPKRRLKLPKSPK